MTSDFVVMGRADEILTKHRGRSVSQDQYAHWGARCWRLVYSKK